MRFIHSMVITGAGAVAMLGLWADCSCYAQGYREPETGRQLETLHLAVADLIETFGDSYPNGSEYLRQIQALKATAATDGELQATISDLQKRALLANPLIDFQDLIVLRRKRGQLGLPVNHKCNTGLERTGYDNDIAVLSPVSPSGKLSTLYRPTGSEFVGEIDLHFDGNRLLFTMPKGPTWQIWEIAVDGSQLRQVSRSDATDVDNFDACYLPDGGIVFGSTASFHAVPCWHGEQRASALYRMDADGTNVRQLCFDQDLDLYPAVLPTGQVIYSRWDYTGTMHMYLRPLMAMNPDGTGQRAIYGSNSFWPNALYFARGIPGAPDKLVSIIAGYHGVPRMGELGVIDLGRGWQGADGVVQRIPGRGKPIKTVIRDNLVDDSWPKFLHPWPLSDKYFLVAAQLSKQSNWGIYLVDVFDNIVPIKSLKGFDLFEPIPLKQTVRPPIIPDRTDTERDDAVVYMHDVYSGPGLAGVPQGTVKALRVLAYHFGYPGMAGPDKIGCGGPWEAMRIIGTVDVHNDGSAHFVVPANTPLAVQPLDAEGKSIQVMRSWFTAMPGEVVSCVGCHEQPRTSPDVRYDLAARRLPQKIKPWYGPPRGFDFEREVQPVLSKQCARCHDGQPRENGHRIVDLRAERFHPDYTGRTLARLGRTRLHPDLRKSLGGEKVRYTPAYEALIPYIRRVNIEDQVTMHVPGEYHVDTSELVQMLRKGHHGVALAHSDWDRLITWIDLNAPCHGTWNDVGPVPDRADRRRREMQQQYSGPTADFEQRGDSGNVSAALPGPPTMRERTSSERTKNVTTTSPDSDWPLAAGQEPPDAAGQEPPDAAGQERRATGQTEMTLNLGGNVTMQLTRIPSGRFLMGSSRGKADEQPPAVVPVEKGYWIGTCEVSNAQFRRYDPDHDSGYFNKRFQSRDGPGLDLNRPQQPAVRVSWNEAIAFCRWLSAKTGKNITLPTEAQWEYACRAGTATELSFGKVDSDFSTFANVADKALARPPTETGGLGSNHFSEANNGVFESVIVAGNVVCDERFSDGVIATAAVGSFKPNSWNLFDVHGNAAEWTRSLYQPLPYNDSDGRNAMAIEGRRVVRGGSFRDRPSRCRSAFRLDYPQWQPVPGVGFRVVCTSLEESD